MATNSSKAEFAQALLAALRHGTFTRNPTASDRINRYSETVKRRLDELTDILDFRGAEYYANAIEMANDLKDGLEKAIENKRIAQVGGITGNALRIAGTLGYAFPVGRIVFWTGNFVSGMCDFIAESERRDIGEFSSQLRRLLEGDRAEFRLAANAIRNLEEAIEAETGWTLYDEDYREFLRKAAEDPERAEELVAQNPKLEDPEHRTNIIQIARDSPLIRVLTHIMEAVQRKDVMLLNVLSVGLFARSFMESCPLKSSAFQVGELAIRGLTLWFEYEKDALTLKQFEEGIERMSKELDAIQKVL